MELFVDRLTLRVGHGLSDGDARRLARLVAERLAAAGAPGAAEARARLQVAVTPIAGESLESMAQRIATAMLQALTRSS